jgi:hypothetical protein
MLKNRYTSRIYHLAGIQPHLAPPIPLAGSAMRRTYLALLRLRAAHSSFPSAKVKFTLRFEPYGLIPEFSTEGEEKYTGKATWGETTWGKTQVSL